MPAKKFKIGALALLSIFSLAACDEIIAKPSDYDTPIVTVEGYDDEIYRDIMSVIYDKIRDGSLGSEVLDEILFEYATSVIGKYNGVVHDARSNASQDTITLKLAYAGITYTEDEPQGDANTDAFINAHKSYWTIDPATKERKTDPESKKAEYNRVAAKWNTIEERICEALYESFANSSSHVYRSKYSQESFLRSLRGDLANVKNPDTLSASEKGYCIFISPDAEPTDIFDYLDRSYYQTSYDQTEGTNTSASWNTYVEDKIIPTIYKQLLIEQYLLDKSYNTLGGSYARRVNVIAIPNNQKYPKAAKSLVEALVNEIHTVDTESTELPVDPTDENFHDAGLVLFKKYSKILTGANLDSEQTAIINSLLRNEGFELKDGAAGQYYGGTEYGDILDNYEKIKVDRRLTDETIENDFTGNGSYTKETGLQIKELEVERKDHTTTGWYIKNGGLSELPESIRTRLFSVGVANALDIADLTVRLARDRYQYSATDGWTYDASRDGGNSFVARINSRFYLKNDQATTENNPDGRFDIVFEDDASSTYYIVQVCEAPITSKLAKNGAKSYAVLRSSARMEAIVNDVLKVVGTGESYKTTSTKYWLEEAAMTYHDEVVYNYFKDNYPDLFD